MAEWHSGFTHIIDLLLCWLPEEKRPVWRAWTQTFLLSFCAIFLTWYGLQWIGPKADGPQEDPLVVMNRVAEALPENAASLYLEAIDARTEPPEEAWRSEVWRTHKPLAAELIGWIEENTESIEKTRAAAQMKYCHFKLARNSNRMLDLTPFRQLRDQIKFMALRARLACERHDIEMLGDTLVTMSGITRHIECCPGAMGDLMVGACWMVGAGYYLEPASWPNVSDAELCAYFDRVASFLEPLPDLGKRLRAEQDELSWCVMIAPATDSGGCFSERRIVAEIQREMRPYLTLAELPTTAIANRGEKAWRVIHKNRNWPMVAPLAILNVPRWVARTLTRFEQVVELHVRADAGRRGLRCTTAIFRYKAEHGTWPSRISELDGDDYIDVFTNQPLVYRVEDESFVLYSCGVDRDDDGGRHVERFGAAKRRIGQDPLPADGDFVFWPLQDPDADSSTEMHDEQ